MEPLSAMLTGGHPNSLGRTLEVVELVLADHDRLGELFACYRSDDAVVRLRTSSALKRIEAARSDWLHPYLGRLIDEIGALNQSSAQWTLAQLFAKLAGAMSPQQRQGALAVMQRNLAEHDDWIVLNTTMDTLTAWAKHDAALAAWLKGHLERLTQDPRKSVARKAAKCLKAIANA